MTRVFKNTIICIIALTFNINAFADAPLVPPKDYIAYSPAQTCTAHTSVINDEIKLYEVRKTNPSEAHFLQEADWVLPNWARSIYLGEQCEFAIVGYGGQNLLSLNHKDKNTTIFSVKYPDGQSNSILLSDIYDDLDHLPQSTDHWVWHEGVRWDGTDLTVYTVDDRKVIFSFPN